MANIGLHNVCDILIQVIIRIMQCDTLGWSNTLSEDYETILKELEDPKKFQDIK
jgi:hypothetical protein